MASSRNEPKAGLRRADEAARALVTCCLLLDPQRIVLVGGVTRSRLIRRMLVDRLTEALPHPPDVVRSGFADDVALYGALALARDTAPASL